MIQENIIGKTKLDTNIIEYILTNKNGMEVNIINYGATIKNIKVPHKYGKLLDVVLGYDTLKEYEKDTFYLGSTIGRVANRIQYGKFSLNSIPYNLSINNGENHLHGGVNGFNKKIWESSIASDNSVEFKYISEDGEEGYPGTLTVSITFSLNDKNQLNIYYNATSDKDTLVNLTNHSYFNLNGVSINSNLSTIENHLLTINSEEITENDTTGIPTGTFIPVTNTPFDFTKPKLIGEHLESRFKQLRICNGYDHNYALSYNGNVNLIAIAKSPKSKVEMKVYTDQRGVQLYTGNFLNSIGKNNESFGKYSGFCLECQNFPNAINTLNFFPSILKKDAVYNHTTIYEFNTLL